MHVTKCIQESEAEQGPVGSFVRGLPVATARFKPQRRMARQGPPRWEIMNVSDRAPCGRKARSATTQTSFGPRLAHWTLPRNAAARSGAENAAKTVHRG